MSTKPSVQPCPLGAVTKCAKGPWSSAAGGMQQGAPQTLASRAWWSRAQVWLRSASGPSSSPGGVGGASESLPFCGVMRSEDSALSLGGGLAGAGRWLWQEGLLQASPGARFVFKRAGTVLDFLSFPHSGSRWTDTATSAPGKQASQPRRQVCGRPACFLCLPP